MSKQSTLIALLCTGILTACDAPTAPTDTVPVPAVGYEQAQSGRSSELVPFTMPIYLDCLDEEVVWSGTVQYDDHWLYRPNGTGHVNGQASLLPGSTIVGESGTWVAPRVVSNYMFDFDNDFFDRNARIVERITWQNAQTGASMVVSFAVHYVWAGNGELKRYYELLHTCTVRE